MRRPKRIEPGPDQESVWDYPRPPRLERTERHIRVEHRGNLIADSTRAWRVLETSQPPAYYIPPEDVAMEYLRPSDQQSFCEWKGPASYFNLVTDDDLVRDAAWCYRTPTEPFSVIQDHLAFYPQRVERCLVDGEEVLPNDGGFYGGWVNSWIVGPFKGGPGTQGW